MLGYAPVLYWSDSSGSTPGTKRNERSQSVGREVDEERGEYIRHPWTDVAGPGPVPDARPRAAGRTGEAGRRRRHVGPQANGGSQPPVGRALGQAVSGPWGRYGRPGTGRHIWP